MNILLELIQSLITSFLLIFFLLEMHSKNIIFYQRIAICVKLLLLLANLVENQDCLISGCVCINETSLYYVVCTKKLLDGAHFPPLNTNYSVITKAIDAKLTNQNYSNLPDFIFNKFHLISLSLSKDSIESIGFNAFAGISSLESLDLSNNLINDIEHIFASLNSLKKLVLSSNAIKSLKNSLCHLNNLLYLALDNNMIRSVNNVDLSCLTKLRLLNLKNNRIDYLQNINLETLHDLAEIDLSENRVMVIKNVIIPLHVILYAKLNRNKIADISELRFKNAGQIKVLDLSANDLASIEAIDFASMNRLQNMIMEFNSINSIDFIDFTSLSDLVQVTFRRNKLKHLTNVDFRNSSRLEEINFSENFLTKLENIHFPTINSIIILDFSKNLIELIIDINFSSLFNLKELHLDYNKLKLVDLNYSLSHLNFLSINNNALRSLDTVNLNKLPSVTSLFVGNNPIESYDLVVSTKLSSLAQFSLQNIQLNFTKQLSLGLFPNLRVLELGENSLETIAPSSLINMSKLLITLDLSKNKLHSIENIDFRDFPKLIKLNLGYNRLSSIKTINFSNINKIKDIVFRANNLSNVDNLNITLTSLTYLDIGINKLISVDNIDFTKFPSLISLNLDQNLLTSVSYMRFLENSALKYLNLSRNQIEHFRKDFFAHLNQLIQLNISYNKIKLIGNDMFAYQLSLKDLDIQNNLIDSFDNTSFLGLSVQVSINIYQSMVSLSLADICNIKSSISFTQRKFNKNLMGIQYYYTSNLITADADDLDCELTLFFIRFNIQLDLNTAQGHDRYVSRCFEYYFKSKKKFISKCGDFLNEQAGIHQSASKYILIASLLQLTVAYYQIIA